MAYLYYQYGQSDVNAIEEKFLEDRIVEAIQEGKISLLGMGHSNFNIFLNFI